MNNIFSNQDIEDLKTPSVGNPVAYLFRTPYANKIRINFGYIQSETSTHVRIASYSVPKSAILFCVKESFLLKRFYQNML